MIKYIKTQLTTFFCCIYRVLPFGGDRFPLPFVLPPLPSQPPFSDAELELCRDALTPIGYTAIKNITTNEIHLYRQKDLREQEKVMELILQQLKQYA